MQNHPLLPVIAIMGPTASGKTASALEIAKHIPSEIISVDSALIYKGMDIGTAKPSAEEQASVPHHLIDIIDPSEAYSAAQFRDDALKLIHDIQQRGKLPLLVGGTMMYFKTLTTGLDDLPSANPTIRKRLEEEANTWGWPALHTRLSTLDPITANRLKSTDSQRIQRALEIIELTGKPLSSLQSGPKKLALPFQLISIALEPSNRLKLHERIAKRFDLMLKDDLLIKEVIKLRSRGDLNLELPAMRCVGYRQTWQYLDGVFDRNTLREKSIIATRQLCKRQLTWLRAIPDRHIVDCLANNAIDQIYTIIQTALQKTQIKQ